MSLADDRFAIQDLVADFAYRWDSRDAQGWAQLFTADGVWELYVAGEGAPLRRLTNVGEMTTAAEETFGRFAELRSRIHQSGTRFESLDADQASARTNLFFLRQLPGGHEPQLVYTGFAQDEFQRGPDGWRFRRRSIYCDQDASTVQSQADG